MKKTIVGIVLSLVASISWSQTCIGDQTANPVRSVYIVPQLTMSRLYVQWLPILERLGKETQQCFEIVIPPTIPDFEQALLSGRPDYAFMNPYHAVMANKAQGYIPLVADSEHKLDGIIVVREDSPYKTIDDLKSIKLTLPAPNAFAASLLTRQALTDRGISYQVTYANTHSNVYRVVALGDADAGGGVNNTFNRENEGLRKKLRVLYRTSQYTPHPFSANPRVPEIKRQLVIDSFIKMGQDSSMRSRLQDAQLNIPSIVDYKRDYAPLEKLNLERFVNYAN